MSKEKFLVTSALPYANGPLHIGHIAGAYLPADIFVRFNKMKGNDIVYICGSDEHGVPITLRAEQEGVSPKEVVERYHRNIHDTFKKLKIDFNNFSGTARPVHYKISQEFFLKLSENGYISDKTVQQHFCDNDNMFLPDRYLEGTCPYCHFENARGDECPRCGKWLEPEKLVTPRCKLCGHSPEIKETKHWFLRLDLLQDQLHQWIDGKENMKDNVKQFAYGWLKEGLNERPITRDISWGVPVPLEEAKGKVLYVWFDAPIGYISATVEWSENIGEPDKWKEYWLDPDCKLIHFIGKDNIPFHIIVWTAILMGQEQNYVLPYDVPANEHLTVEGEKLSTSIGNVVWVDDYLEEFPGDLLRYYLAAMAPETKDSDFSWKSFQEKNNIELSNILGNFVNRTLTFINKNFDGKIPSLGPLTEQDQENLDKMRQYPDIIAKLLSRFKVREAIFEAMELAHQGNRYFDSKKPWKSVKEDKQLCGTSLHICALMIKIITPILFPFMPDSSEVLWTMIGESGLVQDIPWNSIQDFSIEKDKQIGKVAVLFPKIDDKMIKKVEEEFHSRVKNKKEEKKVLKTTEIEIDDFQKVDLRIGTILNCEKVKKSNKLYKLQVKVGGSKRQIISGVAKNYKADELIGKQVLVVANLKKVKLMGEESEGMILFAEDQGKLTLISPIKEVEDGSQVS